MSRERLREKILEYPKLYPRATKALKKNPNMDFASLIRLVTEDTQTKASPKSKTKKEPIREEAPLSHLVASKVKQMSKGPNSALLKVTAKGCRNRREVGGIGATRKALSMIREWQQLIDKSESRFEKELLEQDLKLFIASLTEKPQKKPS